MAKTPLARAILLQALHDRGFKPGQVIATETRPQPTFVADWAERSRKFLRDKLSPDIDESTIDAFLQSNQAQASIIDIYGALEDLILIDGAAMKEIFAVENRGGWDNFRKIYPQSEGCLSLSHPGFSLDGNQCLLEIGQQMDFLWGHGKAYLYVRSNAGWVKKAQTGTWIS